MKYQKKILSHTAHWQRVSNQKYPLSHTLMLIETTTDMVVTFAIPGTDPCGIIKQRNLPVVVQDMLCPGDGQIAILDPLRGNKGGSFGFFQVWVVP